MSESDRLFKSIDLQTKSHVENKTVLFNRRRDEKQNPQPI